MFGTTAKEDKFPVENYICDPAYAEYESCENTNVIKKWASHEKSFLTSYGAY